MPNFYYQYLLAARFFKKSLEWERNKLVEYQNLKLVEMVKHAGKNVPYYRDLFHKIGLDPATFKGIEDIKKIPLLDNEEIRKAPARFCADNYEKYGGQWTKTSGSTGTPLRLRIDTVSRAWKYAATIRAYKQAGYRYLKKTLVVQGYSDSKKEPFGFRPGNNSLFINASRINNKTVMDFYPLLMNHRPKIILGYARSIALMFDLLNSNNKELPPVESVVNYGENLRKETGDFIRKIAGCKVFDFYSHAENTVMISTFADGSLRIAEDYFYPEIVPDKDTILTGTCGELVGTSFYNYAMPLIRYKTRDHVQLSVNESDLKYPFRKIGAISGRLSDKIIMPDGGEVYFVEGAIAYAQGIIASQCIQEQPGTLIVQVIVDDSFREEYFRDIEKGLIIRLGSGMKYEFRIVKELERRDSGKIPFLINRIK